MLSHSSVRTYSTKSALHLLTMLIATFSPAGDPTPLPEMDIQLISLFSHVPLLALMLKSLAPSSPSCHFRYQPELS